jgi:hypothetical protein
MGAARERVLGREGTGEMDHDQLFKKDQEEIRKLLVNVVETYLPLTGTAAEEFEQSLQRPENQRVRQTMKTYFEQDAESAETRGVLREAGEAVLRVFAARFGPVPEAVATRVRQIDDKAVLDALLDRVATATSPAETGLL